MRLKGGERYNLSEIFGANHQVVIPDIQRDFCWGLGEHRELVREFVTALLELYRSEGGSAYNLGLLYAYTEEGEEDMIQLCDGQQRLTTLFLLIGVLSRNLANKYKTLLVSDDEWSDDYEPRLRYAMRETSHYFLSDMVRFYLCEPNAHRDISSADWYIEDYTSDPSVEAMLSATRDIEGILDEYTELEGFADFVVNRLHFIYYDTEQRSLGEETLVIINTTGEPLSTSEQLKPRLVLGNPPLARQWEEVERYFWSQRGDNATADNGIEEFLCWLLLVERAEVLTLSDLQTRQGAKYTDGDIAIIRASFYQYYQWVRALFGDSDWGLGETAYLAPPESSNSDAIRLVVVVMLYYIKCFSLDNKRLLRSLRYYLESTVHRRSVRNNIPLTLLRLIELIGKMRAEGIADIVQTVEHKELFRLDAETRCRFSILLLHHDRAGIEALWFRHSKHPLFLGSLERPIRWSMSGRVFDRARYEDFFAFLKELFPSEPGREVDDVLRRALIARVPMQDKRGDGFYFPRKHKGSTSYSFARNLDEWYALLVNRAVEPAFIRLIDTLYMLHLEGRSWRTVCENIAMRESRGKPFEEFALIPELLAFMQGKSIQHWGERGWVLLAGEGSSKVAILRSYLLLLELRRIGAFSLPWRTRYHAGAEGNCGVLMYESQIAIDISYLRRYKGEDEYVVDIYYKDKERSYDPIKRLIESYSYTIRKVIGGSRCRLVYSIASEKSELELAKASLKQLRAILNQDFLSKLVATL